MEHVDTVIIGAGVVGLAIARQIASMGREVLILESETAIGSVTSARNSGVIHAGIYYRTGSLKAQLCVRGRKLLYAYAKDRGINHRRCGKLIVATAEDQMDKLLGWKKQGEDNHVEGLRLLTAAEAKQFEPEVFCVAAVHSSETGIVDVHEYMLALLGDAEANGATLALQSPIDGAHTVEDGFRISVGGVSAMDLHCHYLINAAGLEAQAIARRIEGLDTATVPGQVLAKGNYFSLSGKPPFKMLIYPLPVLGSSGLHATCDLGGRIRFGPDVEWVDHIDYGVDPARQAAFEASIRHYWPALPQDALQPDYAGIRPKLARASPHDIDFMIQTSKDHSITGLINLYGIESPGLTASLAIAEYVAARLEAKN
jgi:L-2-hydroxyglutarate oxidase LhgO